MSRRVMTKIKISLAILGRGFSACLCFLKMEEMAMARLKRSMAMPSAGTVEGRNGLAPRMDNKSKAEKMRACFLRKRCIDNFRLL